MALQWICMAAAALGAAAMLRQELRQHSQPSQTEVCVQFGYTADNPLVFYKCADLHPQCISQTFVALTLLLVCALNLLASTFLVPLAVHLQTLQSLINPSTAALLHVTHRHKLQEALVQSASAPSGRQQLSQTQQPLQQQQQQAFPGRNLNSCKLSCKGCTAGEGGRAGSTM
jgi:hypothetical protein